MQEGPGPKQITSSTHIIIFNSRCDMLGTLTPPPPQHRASALAWAWCVYEISCMLPSAGGALEHCRPPSAGGLKTAGPPLPVESWYSAGPPLPVEPWCSAGPPPPVV